MAKGYGDIAIGHDGRFEPAEPNMQRHDAVSLACVEFVRYDNSICSVHAYESRGAVLQSAL